MPDQDVLKDSIRLARHPLSDATQMSPATIWKIFCCAAVSFAPLLFLQYEGEEPFFTIIAQEMWASRDFTHITHLGNEYPRPGLFPWLIIALSTILGWENVLIAARAIAVTSTILTGLTIAWLATRIYKDRLVAAFAAAIFLSGDVLLYRGWLAYSDPVFALFTFGAMACLWVATQERRNDLLVLAVLALVGAFLSKVPTTYVFYATLGLVLLWKHENRFFLFRPVSLALHAAAVAFPLFWSYAIVGNSYFDAAISNLLFTTLHPPSWSEYVTDFIAFPFSVTMHLLPGSAVVIYAIYSRQFELSQRNRSIDIAIWTALLSLIPYWISPYGSTRYLLPTFPFFALIMAYCIVRSGKSLSNVMARLLVANIAVGLIGSLVAIPLYQRHVRGNYAELARMILAHVGEEPIYANDVTTVGLSLVANLNTMRPSRTPIIWPPQNFSSGYVLAREVDPSLGEISLTFSVGRNADGKRTRYLLCRGPACSQPKAP
jgi:4-amino-4-deoxy-L-arabinose transferase-like glycosyltransferase